MDTGVHPGECLFTNELPDQPQDFLGQTLKHGVWRRGLVHIFDNLQHLIKVMFMPKVFPAVESCYCLKSSDYIILVEILSNVGETLTSVTEEQTV